MTSSDGRRSGGDRQLQRYLDSELPAAEAADFAARMLADADLRERVRVAEAEQKAVRGAFAASACTAAGRLAGEVTAPAGFTAGVMAEVARLPSRAQLQHMEVVDGATRMCRRLLLAAMLLFGLGLGWQVGLFDRGRADTLQAAPGDVQQEMDRLDALILQSDLFGSGTAGTAEVPRRGK